MKGTAEWAANDPYALADVFETVHCRQYADVDVPGLYVLTDSMAGDTDTVAETADYLYRKVSHADSHSLTHSVNDRRTRALLRVVHLVRTTDVPNFVPSFLSHCSSRYDQSCILSVLTGTLWSRRRRGFDDTPNHPRSPNCRRRPRPKARAGRMLRTRTTRRMTGRVMRRRRRRSGLTMRSMTLMPWPLLKSSRAWRPSNHEPCNVVQCRAVPCSAVQCRAMPCSAVQCRAVQWAESVPCRLLAV